MMRLAIALSVLLLPSLTAARDEDAAILRAVLAEVAGASRTSYCVRAALDEPPFVGLRRDMAERAALEAELAEFAGKVPLQPHPADAAASLRAITGQGWTPSPQRRNDPELLARIAAAAAAVAERGDPTPLPEEPVGELNVSDGAADAVASEPAQPMNYGRLRRAWLAPSQGLAEDCPMPNLTLSAVAREGEFAFVSVGRVWDPLAGVGEIWALRREGAVWHVVATRHEWVS